MKKVVSMTLAPLFLTTTLPSLAQDNSQHSGPMFSGEFSGGLLNVDNRDIDPWAFKAEAGLGGSYTINDDISIRYDMVADFANAINSVDEQTWTPGSYRQDDGEIYLRTARALLITKYGSIGFQPRVPSGFWNQIYNNIDVFEYNRFHGQTG
ncbi:hypothetical protein P1P91_14935 [Halomonas piscis]|uniref:Outer membrane protein beta-barrel domain-containing protein n=1 Tax=Halomonas piscis TaxID=3031727 RepID=A0ABY9YYZ0_9GAMM|nr:hypothetical protein [Halomonas piscis]WNK20084.1 hypothetical protein P1P91_14935 [Halomonas piscis]